MVMQGEWSFDEGSGTTAADMSGNDRTATGIPGWNASGHTSSAVSVNGVSQGAQVDLGTSYDFTAVGGANEENVTRSTFMCWFRLNSLIDGQQIVRGPRYGGSGEWIIGVTAAGELFTTGQGTVTTSATLTTGTWYHVALAVDWAYGAGPPNSNVRVYLDGNLVGSGEGFPLHNWSPLYWGGLSTPLDGFVDDARWDSTQLSQAAIRTSMNTPVAGVSAPSAKRWWKSDSGTWLPMNTQSMIPGSGSQAPTVANVNPSSGPLTGGNQIVITGTNYFNQSTVSSVTIGGNPCAVTDVTATAITCTTPANATEGQYDIVVTTIYGVATLTNGYSYAAPPVFTGKGWELTTANTGLNKHGLDGPTLPLYIGPEKPAAYTTITEQRITTGLDVSNGNITLERCYIAPAAGSTGSVIMGFDNNSVSPGKGPVTIRDCTITGINLTQQQSAFSLGIQAYGTFTGNLITNLGSGIGVMGVGLVHDSHIEGNYVTDLTAYGDPAGSGNHSDAFTIRDYSNSSNPARKIDVFNNRFDCDSGNDSGACFLQTYAGDIDNVTIDGNMLEGGAWLFWINSMNGNGYSNIRVTDNRFRVTTGYPAGAAGDGSPIDVWQDNHHYAAGQPDFRGVAVSSPS